ncbi:hypothetical protein EYZ11_012442 [Aspergillus tanneri]|uniref:Uncharacterized protein n=1 Tax=Aspergillus tanneri TaxID=1220188 RepID=A0A4S3J0T6_9EURO|nr:hypothetical protein EYZ11_012442 [Aspergillus tanneri]
MYPTQVKGAGDDATGAKALTNVLNVWSMDFQIRCPN